MKNPWDISISTYNPQGILGNYGRNNHHKKKAPRTLTGNARIIAWEMSKGHKCHICHRTIHSLSEAEPDHTRAHSKGGTTMQWTHRACNRLKGSKQLKVVQKMFRIKGNKKGRKKKKPQVKENGRFWVNPLTGKKEKIVQFFKT